MEGDTLSVELPLHPRADRIATEQLICTTAAAYRAFQLSADLVTVDMTDDSGRHVRGADEGCPDP